MIEVRVPKWGLTMEDATVVEWLKAPGDRVTDGEDLVELETDKVSGMVPSPANGTLAEIVAPPETLVIVEELLALIEEE